jgi:hypothetical protein
MSYTPLGYEFLPSKFNSNNHFCSGYWFSSTIRRQPYWSPSREIWRLFTALPGSFDGSGSDSPASIELELADKGVQ